MCISSCLSKTLPVLLNVLVSRMSVTAIGDFLFGLLLFAVNGNHSALGIVQYVAAVILVALIYLFFYILTQSLAFFIGNAEGLGYQFFITLVTLSTYPTDIFKGWGRVILFTVLPAGFISYMPIGFLREFQPSIAWGVLAAVILLGAGGMTLFYRGLARYSSGNRMGVRM